MNSAPRTLASYRPSSPEYQGRLREDIRHCKAFGLLGPRYQDMMRRARRVARATGLTVKEIIESA